jgi:hypothetical protein
MFIEKGVREADSRPGAKLLAGAFVGRSAFTSTSRCGPYYGIDAQVHQFMSRREAGLSPVSSCE